jgi:hypothetical protein
MSAVPELKQKKIARDQALGVASKAAAEKSAQADAAFTKAITERAKAYEAEYEKVMPYLVIRFNFLISVSFYPYLFYFDE